MDQMQQRVQEVSHGHAAGGNVKSGITSKILMVLLIIVSILLIAYLALKLTGGSGQSGDTSVKGKQLQALFLTNGQVYFGNLSQVNESYVKLKNIYYLQVQQTVQPKDPKATTEQPQVSLAKLGGELHGPEDTMYVSREQVLFWENLKTDGKVAKAVQDFQATGNK